MDQRILPVAPHLLKLLCRFLLDSVHHTVLPHGIRPQCGEQSPKMIIGDHLHPFVVVQVGRGLTMTEILTVQAVTEILAVQAVIEILAVQAVTESVIVQAMTESVIMTVTAGIVTITGPGIQKKEGITEASVKIVDTDAPAHVIGAEARVVAGVGAGVGVGVGAGMSIDPVHLGIQAKRRRLLPRAT